MVSFMTQLVLLNIFVLVDICFLLLDLYPGSFIDLLNVIGFLRATDHMITMLCQVTKIVDGKNISGSIDTS